MSKDFAFYHATHANNVDSIRDKGLVPSSGRLHFTKRSSDAGNIANKMYGSQGRVVKFTLPEDHTPTNQRGDNEGMPTSLQMTNKTVPPSNIKKVYPPSIRGVKDIGKKMTKKSFAFVQPFRDPQGKAKYFIDNVSEMMTSHHPGSEPEEDWSHVRTHPNGVKEYRHEEGAKGFEVLAKDGMEAAQKFKQVRK